MELSRLSDKFFSDLLYKDTPLSKALGDKDLRVKVLVRAIQMSLNEFGHDQESWIDDEEILNRRVSKFVTKAFQATKTENSLKYLNLGDMRTNYRIVTRTILSSFELKGSPVDGTSLRDKRFFESLTFRLDKLSQQISTLSTLTLDQAHPPLHLPFPTRLFRLAL